MPFLRKYKKREAIIDYKKNYKTKLENAIKANEKYHQKRLLNKYF